MTKFLRKAAAASRLSWVDGCGDMLIFSLCTSYEKVLYMHQWRTMHRWRAMHSREKVSDMHLVRMQRKQTIEL